MTKPRIDADTHRRLGREAEERVTLFKPPFHPFVCGFAAFAIASLAISAAGGAQAGAAAAVPMVFGGVVWWAMHAFDTRRERAVEAKLAELIEAEPSTR